jgi:hypothetical protein
LEAFDLRIAQSHYAAGVALFVRVPIGREMRPTHEAQADDTDTDLVLV